VRSQRLGSPSIGARALGNEPKAAERVLDRPRAIDAAAW
jgi:hypothetical protein